MALRTPALLTAGLVLALTGCASSGSTQRPWAETVEQADGVEAVQWEWVDSWPASPSHYTAELSVSRVLTLEQAAEIAVASCDTATEIKQLSINNSVPSNSPGAVSAEVKDSPCLDPLQLDRYARTTQAIATMPQDFAGTALVVNAGVLPLPHVVDAASALGVRVMSPNAPDITDALVALHGHGGGEPLIFAGEVTGKGATADRITFNAQLTPTANIDELVSLISKAGELRIQSLRVTDNSMTVMMRSSSDLNTPDLAALKTRAAQAGVSVHATLMPFVESVSENHEELLAALLAVPWGLNITAPELSESTVTVEAWSDDGALAASELVLASDFNTYEFLVFAPGPPQTWLKVRPQSGTAQQLETAASAVFELRDELESVHKVYGGVTQNGVFLYAELTAERPLAAVDQARLRMQALADSGEFDSVKLTSADVAADQTELVRSATTN